MMAEVIGLAAAYHSTLLAGAVSSTGEVVASNTSGIVYWWWRFRGRGSYRVMFGHNCTVNQQRRIMKFFSVEARDAGIKALSSYTYTGKDGKIRTIQVPYRGFKLKSGYYVVPLLGSSAEIAGYEFWTRCFFRYGSKSQYKKMCHYVNALLGCNVAYHARKNQIVPLDTVVHAKLFNPPSVIVKQRKHSVESSESAEIAHADND